MKPALTSVTLWLATRLLASAAVTGPLNSPGVVLPVELNGVSSFFGHQRAFFVLNQPDQPGPCSFTLAVGESRFGIKLLAVNEALDHVEIENGGQKQTLRIRSATASAQPSPITELTGFAAKLTIRKIGAIAHSGQPWFRHHPANRQSPIQPKAKFHRRFKGCRLGSGRPTRSDKRRLV
jgi:hypothetical protein